MGLLQPFADVIKLMFKEELRPGGADTVLFLLAPVISATAAFAAFAVVPFGAETTFFGLLDEPIKLQVADVNVAVLVVFAITSMSVYGIVLAGWSSNSKYSLLGGLRSASQMISYELSYGLALASVLRARQLAVAHRHRQRARRATGSGSSRAGSSFVQPVGFLIFMIAGVAETNRAPFDFPEAEQELVAGYHTEYSSMAFAMFFLAEYINMVTVSAVATDLFLGGWHGPFLPESLGWIWFLVKIVGAAVLLHLDAVDAAAATLRPADAVRVEGPAAAGGAEPAGDGRGGDSTLALELLLFYVFAAVAVAASAAGHRAAQPDHSVLLLIVSFAALAGLYVLLDAPFVAVIQIIIYAGAIMVLFLFVVMLLNAHREDDAGGRAQRLARTGRCGSARCSAVVLVVELVWALVARGARRASRAGGGAGADAQALAVGPRHRAGALHRLRVRRSR